VQAVDFRAGQNFGEAQADYVFIATGFLTSDFLCYSLPFERTHIELHTECAEIAAGGEF
jgi:hypothetical protein